jgi:HAD superfamily hydrolase (TIGR01549 family)
VLNSYPLKAVLWDFDGTMADTRERNLSVNRRIFEEVTERPWTGVAALTSTEAYDAAWSRVGNWQELYTEALGLDAEQLKEAGRRWAPFQLDDHTEVPLIDGIGRILEQLRDLPQAVVSQNDRAIISQILGFNGVDHFFTAIVGYAEVSIDRQKPAPDGLFRAIEILGVEEPATALFIGDHESDIACAANANRDLIALGHELRFQSVAVNFLGDGGRPAWTAGPDHEVDRPAELGNLIAGLRVDLGNG